jgi:aminopeptidase S
VSGTRAKAFAARLARLGPRPAGSQNERRASAIVGGELRKLGYRVSSRRVGLPNGGSSRNVLGLTPGPIRALVVAHVDGVSEGPAANDNASGVAVLLEVARELRGRRGLLVAALGAEERVETGSSIHLGSARLLRGISDAGRRRIRVALSLDMVGVGTSLHVRGVEPVPNRSARAALVQARRLGIRATYLSDYGESDHAEMTRGGLPAAWLQRRFDACWHRACDRAERLSPVRLRDAARVALATVRAALDR